ncbi:ATP-binding protein [Segatella copri]|uniref:ATP-binding protein n=1 Tax=Segatella copri TaxID=165179 RepID=UPI002FEFBE51
MLKEIFCSKFKQPKIVFHKGLNVILGDDNGSNSIGKSTMLLIIDYVFGGDTYAKSDVIDHIGQHEICFCFEFGEVNSYYKRKTAQSKTVFVTDAHYENEKELSLDDYRKILLQFYNIHDENVSFRNIVGLYSRIYGKDNCNEKFVLSANSKQSFDDSISCLIKIFGKYPEIQNRKEAKKM